MDNMSILSEETKETKIDWKRKLTSRKLWMAIALFVSGVLTATGHKDKSEVAYGLIMQGAAVIAYIIGEGLADAAHVAHNSDMFLPDDEVE